MVALLNVMCIFDAKGRPTSVRVNSSTRLAPHKHALIGRKQAGWLCSSCRMPVWWRWRLGSVVFIKCLILKEQNSVGSSVA